MKLGSVCGLISQPRQAGLHSELGDLMGLCWGRGMAVVKRGRGTGYI